MTEFSVCDPQTPKRCIEAINGSFDSIKEMIADYKPKETVQDYAIIFYKGNIKEGQSLYVDKECENAIPVYCQYGGRSRNSYMQMKKMGYTNVYNLYGGIDNL